MRLFVAIELSRAAKDAIGSEVATLKPSHPEVSWVRKDHLHCTLAFLGATSFVDKVVELVRRTVEPLPPLALRIGGMGAFPSAGKARVVWVGLDGDVDALAGTAEAVLSSLEPLGFELRDRPFTPHVTIARLRMPGPVDLGSIPLPPLEFLVPEVVVFTSVMRRSGPIYEAIERAPLRG